MITVLGASGRTGRATTAALRAAGRAPRLVTRGTASLLDEDALAMALEGTRSVYAILPDNLQDTSFHDTRGRMAASISRAVRRAGVEHVVVCSALPAADAAGFGRDLASFEAAFGESDAALTILRAAYFQDNVLASVPLAQQKGIYPSVFSTRAQIPMVATVDVGGAAAMALLDGPPLSRRETIDVLGPEYCADDVAMALSLSLGRDVRVVQVPPEAHEATFSGVMSIEAARAMADTIAWLEAAARVGSAGRVVRGGTTIGEVLR